MNFNQLRYFVAIVKHGSFWSAALEEYISQSSLSKQIKALETELGVVLFNRTGNKITLTEAGQCFYDYALQLLETKNEMHQELMAFEDTPIEEVNSLRFQSSVPIRYQRCFLSFRKSIKIAGRSLIIIFWKKNRKTY